MKQISTHGPEEVCRRIAICCAACLCVLTASVEVGWLFDVPILKSTIPGFIAMNPTTGLLLLMGAITILFRIGNANATRTLAVFTSMSMVGVASIKIVGYGFGQSLAIDRLLFWSKLDPFGPFHGNALAPNAAFCFVLAGLAIPTLVKDRSPIRLASAAILVTLAVSVTAFIGYAFAALPFYEFGTYAPMALPTSVGFLLLGVSCIALHPHQGIAKVFTEEAVGSVLVRKLLPIATLTPFMTGIAWSTLQNYKWVDPAAGTAVAIVLSMAVIGSLILASARAMNATDRQRQDAEKRLIELTEKLRDAALRAEIANQSKSLFLANMSHEVRTPLNGVLGTASLLESRDLPNDERKLVRIIRSSGETLLRVIDDILDFSKIEAGKLEIETLPVNLSELVMDITSLYQAQADSRGITLCALTPEVPPPAVLTDGVRLKQVLGNLISNAIKFTTSGGVQVHLEESSAGEGFVRVVFKVIDTGIGIPESRQQAVFESFTQADATTHRRFGGTGLGLAICKRIVDLMGGVIDVQSVPKVGSTFSVTLRLPLAPITLPRERRAVDVALPISQRVLLAEDNEVNSMVATSLLEDLGCTVVAVGDGHSAIAAIECQRFDTVLMDLQMPVMNGFDAARAIRLLPNGRNVRIIALTASTLPQDVQACLLAGMDGYLTKPFTRDRFMIALTETSLSAREA